MLLSTFSLHAAAVDMLHHAAHVRDSFRSHGCSLSLSVALTMTLIKTFPQHSHPVQEEFRMWQRSTAPVAPNTEEAEVQGRETSGAFGNGKLYRPQVSATADLPACGLRLSICTVDDVWLARRRHSRSRRGLGQKQLLCLVIVPSSAELSCRPGQYSYVAQFLMTYNGTAINGSNEADELNDRCAGVPCQAAGPQLRAAAPVHWQAGPQKCGQRPGQRQWRRRQWQRQR